MKKGQKITYTSWLGYRYSAVIQRAHKDGDFTIQVYFPLDDAGQEKEGCFQGFKMRVTPKMVEA